MIQSARAAITNTSNEQALAEFSQKSDNVSSKVYRVHSFVNSDVHHISIMTCLVQIYVVYRVIAS